MRDSEIESKQCSQSRDVELDWSLLTDSSNPNPNQIQYCLHSYFLRKVNLVLVSVNPETLSEAFKCVSKHD